MIKKYMVIEKLRGLFNQFVPPKYDDDTLRDDYYRIRNSVVDDYLRDGNLQMFKPDSKPWPGKRIIWNFQPHIWDVKTQGKPLIKEAWGNGPIFERALVNLVNGATKISFDRIVRELAFTGVGIPSQIHPGFCKAVLQKMGAKPGDILYDPCAGWGARLLAASCLNLRYVATELSELTFNGLLDIANFVGYDNCAIYNKGFDTIDIPAANMMFTSPPFGSEEYIDSDASIDLNKLLKITSHIGIRIFHVNRSVLEALPIKPDQIIDVVGRGGFAAPRVEFLAIYKN